jgi:hypothetical protein
MISGKDGKNGVSNHAGNISEHGHISGLAGGGGQGIGISSNSHLHGPLHGPSTGSAPRHGFAFAGSMHEHNIF